MRNKPLSAPLSATLLSSEREGGARALESGSLLSAALLSRGRESMRKHPSDRGALRGSNRVLNRGFPS